MRKVDDRHKRFVQEYLFDLNATQAAIRSGYSPKGAHVTASRMLKDPDVLKMIEAAQVVMSERTSVTKGWLINEAVRVARKAEMEGRYTAARGTLELLARLHGFIIDRKDMRMVRSFADLSDEEIAALVAEGDRDALRH